MFHHLNSLYSIFLLLNYHLSFLVSASVLVCKIVIILIIIIIPTIRERAQGVASRPGLLPPQSITIHRRMLRTLITRGCFSEGEGLEDFRT